jgi:hypothetical protein
MQIRWHIHRLHRQLLHPILIERARRRLDTIHTLHVLRGERTAFFLHE